MRFDNDEVFKRRAYECVVKLQAKDPFYYNAWKIIYDISMKGEKFHSQFFFCFLFCPYQFVCDDSCESSLITQHFGVYVAVIIVRSFCHGLKPTPPMYGHKSYLLIPTEESMKNVHTVMWTSFSKELVR